MAQHQCRILRRDVRVPKLQLIILIGLRHVKTTGHIKAFAVTESSGVAQGVRRFIAVTGPAAAACSRTAQALDRRLADMEGLSDKEISTVLRDFHNVRRQYF